MTVSITAQRLSDIPIGNGGFISTHHSPKSALPKHAYPAAEEARPAAVGKLFSEQMCTFQSNMAAGVTPSLVGELFLLRAL